MKAKPLTIISNAGSLGYEVCEPEKATHLLLRFPSISSTIVLPVTIDEKRDNAWLWNGSIDKPTIKPSILTNFGDGKICHSYVTDGMVEFLPDSTHELSGKTVDMLDVNDVKY